MAGQSPSPEPKQPLTLVTAFQALTPESSDPPRPHPTIAQHAHVAITAIGALFGLGIMATSADALRVFHATHLGSEFHLPLWPQSFDLAPTIAGVVCGALVVAMNCVALVGQLVPAVCPSQVPLWVVVAIAG
ncbi:hypothetical protein DSL72_007835 [Monilinia vaccinii-corymbosi]|uniref:Uncharacterized protein n=1 Tax=Monilinia vaccinii-corymbosi TaxID=61207 RepID=A0A8A3PIW5_9HELO|nr:hypothetical protein DSL72_007835 [Monilinia vaccinii-corymbosi]